MVTEVREIHPNLSKKFHPTPIATASKRTRLEADNTVDAGFKVCKGRRTFYIVIKGIPMVDAIRKETVIISLGLGDRSLGNKLT